MEEGTKITLPKIDLLLRIEAIVNRQAAMIF
jgi:hypothetical protein